MAMLTVIIPFRNEREEIFLTLAGLRQYSRDFQVIAINDASDDGYDYSALAGMPSVRYAVNPVPRGVAPCRDLGAEMAQTPFLLFLDAHMRIEADVVAPLVRFLGNNPRTLACLQTRVWEGFPPRRRGGEVKTRGCRINFDNKPFAAEWLMLKECHRDQQEIEIPCVMGAAYGIGREYYRYLHGLKGLAGWGFDEQFLSLKVWLEGGRCMLLKNVEVGHVYRPRPPYLVSPSRTMQNRWVIMTLLLPERTSSKYREDGDFSEEEIRLERAYLESIFTREWEDVCRMNREAV